MGSGHEVAVQVNEDLRASVEAAGHRFFSDIPNAQTSGRYFLESGAGIDLRTNRAMPHAIKEAVDEIYAQPRYGERAQQLSLEFASHDAKAELLRLIEECVRETVGG